MKSICIDPRTDPLWRRLVDRSESTIFHSPSWAQVLSDTYGWEVRACVVLDSRGEPSAGIPFCRIKDDIRGERIVALPFSDYCDPLGKDIDCWKCMVEGLLAEGCPITLRCLHNGLPLADERFSLVKQAKWHGLNLMREQDVIWRGLDDSTHRAVKKSQRDGVVVRIAQTRHELRAFFEMHLKIRKYKYGLLAQPFNFFESIWEQFVERQRGFLLLAVYEQKIIGGIFFLQWKDTLYYKFNASLSVELSHRPNDLLIWEGIKYGKASGCTYLDFGLSDWDQEGLVRYKRKFATEEKTISFLQHIPNGAPAHEEKLARDLLNELTHRFTDQSVPDRITESAGSDFYRLFA